MLQTAYKDVDLLKIQIYKWLSGFKNGYVSPDDRLLSGRPSTSRTNENMKIVQELIFEDHHRSTDELVITIPTKEFQMKRVATKSVLYLQSEDQKQS